MEYVMKLNEIMKRIGQVRGMVQNVNDFVQATAVGIVEHAKEHGDCSPAKKLVQALPVAMNRAFLQGWFEHFGSIQMNLKDDKSSSFISRDSKRYRGIDVDGAKANTWYSAIGEDGKVSDWYAGPRPPEYTPATFLDFGNNIARFADRTADQLGKTKDVNGKQVPYYNLTADQQETAKRVLGLVQRVAASITDAGTLEALQTEAATLQARIEEGSQLLEEAPLYQPKTANNG